METRRGRVNAQANKKSIAPTTTMAPAGEQLSQMDIW
jgi:hypothetical protein